jgi:hypothetical protein
MQPGKLRAFWALGDRSRSSDESFFWVLGDHGLNLASCVPHWVLGEKYCNLESCELCLGSGGPWPQPEKLHALLGSVG